MKSDLFIKPGMLMLAVLLALNLGASLSSRVAAQSHPESSRPIRYKVVRVDSGTNQDNLFEKAGHDGLELAGTIEIAGNTGYLIFRK